MIDSTVTDEERLAQVEREYQQAKREFNEASSAARTYQAVNRTPAPVFFRDGKAYIPVNREQRCDAVLEVLQNEAEKARRRFTEALRVRAEMRMRIEVKK